ncbi:MAG: response regulator [Pirellulaceae bacterium]|nr:response regulator [Pirellulaceae bacterium]
MQPLRAWILRWLVPRELQADPATARQAVRTIVFALAMLLWWPIFTPVYIWLGSARAGAIITLGALSALAVIVCLGRIRSLVVAGNLTAAIVYLVLVGLASVAGGIEAAALWWLCAVPIIGLVLCGTRSGLSWAIVSALTILAFYTLHVLHVAVPHDIPADNVVLLDSLSMCGVVFCAFLLTLAFRQGEEAARQELERARDASEQANRAKSLLLANMSHEIRTPMNTVIGMTDLVLSTELSRDQREYLNIVQQSGESLLVLIDDILDFSLLEARRLTLYPQPFDMTSSICHALKALGARAQKQGLELVCRCDLAVPRVVIGDQGRLRQVLVNLIGNAIKFTPHGHVVLEVRCVECKPSGARVSFSVADTGIGIPPEKQEAIFRVFEQAEMSTKRRYGGAGLGLAISQELVQMMGGRIEVVSEVGRGSRFSFTVPLGIPGPDAEPPLVVRARPLAGHRALVVDDSAVSRDALADTLEQVGMVVARAPHGTRALELLHEAQAAAELFDVVITDAHMPMMDGFLLARRVRDDPRLPCRVIVMRAAGDVPRDEKYWEQAGVAAHLIKPVTPPELLDVLLNLLVVPTESTPRAAPQVRAPGHAEAAGGRRILLVDDSLMNQKLAATILGNGGYDVVIANDGREAVAAWQRQPVDLILMDIQMPEMDGFEATRLIREQERAAGGHVPIVALTAHALKGDRDQCLQAGMDGYIAKPLRARELLEAVASTLGADHHD